MHSQSEESEQLKALFECTHDAVFFIDFEGRFTRVNHKACEMLGYSEEVLMKMGYTRLSADTESSDCIFDRLLAGDSVPVYEQQFYTKSGSVMPVEIRAVLVRDCKGEPLYIQSTVRDISEKKRAAAETKAREAYENRLKEVAHLQQAIVDLSIRFVKTPVEQIDGAIDEALERIGQLCGVDRSYYFKYDFEKRIAINICEWCSPGISHEKENLQEVPFGDIEQWLERHVKGESIYIESVENLQDTDPLKDILSAQNIHTLVTVPMMNDGKCMGFVGFDGVRGFRHWNSDEIALLEMLSGLFVNAERRRRYELEIVRAKNEAVSANAVKSRFLANVGHEIRTPLNGIIGMLSLALKSDLPPEQKRQVEKAQEASASLLSLLNDLLDFSKLEAGKTVIQSSRFNLKKLTDNVVATVLPIAIEKKLTLSTEIGRSAAGIFEGDPARIKQILLNLLINAVKFTHRGKVALKVYENEAVVNADKWHDVREIVFEIIDTGIGISQDQLPMVFSPFYQVDDRKSRQYGGTGLGLTIVKELVENMHGQVSVQSELKGGTQFRVTLPLKAVELSENKHAETYAQTDRDLKEPCALSTEMTVALRDLEAALKAQKPKQSYRLLQALDAYEDIGETTKILHQYVEEYDFKAALEVLDPLIGLCREKNHEKT